jgi:hypothetical protein
MTDHTTDLTAALEEVTEVLAHMKNLSASLEMLQGDLRHALDRGFGDSDAADVHGNAEVAAEQHTGQHAWCVRCQHIRDKR